MKYSWVKFKFGVIEYRTFPKNISSKEKREILLKKEQHYLDTLNPSLNICKEANSPLGVKREITFSINLSKACRGNKYKKPSFNSNNIIKVIYLETKSKISLRNQGVNVKIFVQSNNLINEFSSIASAAKHLGVTHKTISMVYKTGKSFDEYTYKFSIKDNRIWVYNVDNKLINILENAKKTSEFFNIPSSTIGDYEIRKTL